MQTLQRKMLQINKNIIHDTLIKSTYFVAYILSQNITQQQRHDFIINEY